MIKFYTDVSEELPLLLLWITNFHFAPMDLVCSILSLIEVHDTDRLALGRLRPWVKHHKCTQLVWERNTETETERQRDREKRKWEGVVRWNLSLNICPLAKRAIMNKKRLEGETSWIMWPERSRRQGLFVSVPSIARTSWGKELKHPDCSFNDWWKELREGCSKPSAFFAATTVLITASQLLLVAGVLSPQPSPPSAGTSLRVCSSKSLYPWCLCHKKAGVQRPSTRPRPLTPHVSLLFDSSQGLPDSHKASGPFWISINKKTGPWLGKHFMTSKTPCKCKGLSHCIAKGTFWFSESCGYLDFGKQEFTAL